MKKGIILVMMIMLGIVNLMSQERIDVLDSMYVAGTTDTTSVTYSGSYNGSVYYDGIVGFQFTMANYVDSFSHVYLMGSWDNGVNLVFIDSASPIADSTYFLYETPPKFPKYYLEGYTATGDTASLKNIIQVAKKTKK